MRRAATIAVGWCVGLAALGAPAKDAKPRPLTAEQAEFFERRVRPVLVENCQSCHGPRKQMSGLRLDSRDNLLKGGDNGPVVKLGDPDHSPLVQAIRHIGDRKMPPKKKLTFAQIDAVTAWVKMG